MTLYKNHSKVIHGGHSEDFDQYYFWKNGPKFNQIVHETFTIFSFEPSGERPFQCI